MVQIDLTADLRTASGEVQDIMVDGRYTGSLLLIYREGERLSGSLQLEQESIEEEVEQLIIDKVHAYVRTLADAVAASYYEVLVSCGTLHSVLQPAERSEETLWSSRGTAATEDDELYDEESRYGDDFSGEVNIIPASRDGSFTYEDQEHLLEMEMISAGRNLSSYVFNDVEGEEVAEATLKQYGADAQGEIHWYEEPDDMVQEAAAELLVRELDEEIIDTITIRIWHQGNELQTLEWVHRDFSEELEEDEEQDNSIDAIGDMIEPEEAEEACYVMLRNKDREFRIYDLFVQERGGLPVGTATIDTSHSDLTGYMDYDVPGTSVQRKTLVEVLMRELNKEIEFDSLHLTMLYRNQIIDEARMEG
ncbi:hypothetical protein [Paenibacillus cucumis (ex Kampfer et al. 2016)]|uniref:Uncharacterized protein n=1 Tax=Paenibacillus cucumis (ex Kampfer et al. 2016) TaxID=1776858 RepID=A0ABS7KCN9_9BACL|nr:hypothetical protein [Paenibacillus cucumis (ex Kampfer et al. 2016)]MBY0201900.1 hypothetical protein [Paenibacillus cucumis (ex Kampfer et al. 2016)]